MNNTRIDAYELIGVIVAFAVCGAIIIALV